MNIREHKFILFLVVRLVIFFSFAACGAQDPAFDELEESEELNATQGDRSTLNPELSPAGNEAVDPEANSTEGGEEDPYAGMEIPEDYEKFSLSFKQTGTKEVDILWVIDSSGSMKEEQTYLGNNFDSFINALAGSEVDFQTAITTSDICNDPRPTELSEIVCPTNYGGNASTHLRGSLVGEAGRKVLYKEDDDLVGKFKAYTDVGTNGSGYEHGLRAAYLAVEKALNGQNEDFLRDDTFLSIVVVSDEEDDGIGLGMADGHSGKNYVADGLTSFRFTHEDLINYLNENVGEGKFAISTITGTRDQDGDLCTSAHSKPDEEGTQYIAAANASGGIVQSICEESWDESLAEIGADLKAQVSQIHLKKEVFPASIRVKVNGQDETRFSYISGTNVIKFEQDAIPETDAIVTVEFYAAP